MWASEGKKTSTRGSVTQVWTKQVRNRDMAQVKCFVAEMVVHSVSGSGPRVWMKKAAATQQRLLGGQASVEELKSIIFLVSVVIIWVTAIINLKTVTLSRKMSSSMWEQLWGKHQAKLLVIKHSCCLQTWSHTRPDRGRKWRTHKTNKQKALPRSRRIEGKVFPSCSDLQKWGWLLRRSESQGKEAWGGQGQWLQGHK